MGHTQKECDSLFWRAVRLLRKDRCALAGQGRGACAGGVETHHLAGRGNPGRYDLELGMVLCRAHHHGHKCSPHGATEAFKQWLWDTDPDKYTAMQEAKHTVKPDRDMDYDAIYFELLAKIRKVDPTFVPRRVA